MKQSKTAHPAKITTILGEIEKLKHERVEGQLLDPRLAQLRQWQSERLARTYADLMRDRRFRPAMQFFLEDVYAARDFSQRNRDIERMYEMLRRVAPEPMIRPLVLTVELHYLTEDLDEQLLDVLIRQLGWAGPLTVALYAEAYRICDNYAVRIKQIELIYEIGQLLNTVVHLPLSGAILNLTRLALERAGWADLMAFTVRGYKAFNQLRGAREFLDTIRTRELGILDRIYANDPEPFRVN